MWGLRYLISYIFGTIIGVYNEYLQKPTQNCYMNPSYRDVFTCGVANVYGWSLVLLSIYIDTMIFYDINTLFVMASIGPLLTIAEAGMGEISREFHGKKTWVYPDEYVPFWNDMVSVVSSIYFTVGGILYYKVIYEKWISKL